MKLCTKCKKRKPESQFSVNRLEKDGLRYQCKQCDHNDYVRRRKNKSINFKPCPPALRKAKPCSQCHIIQMLYHFNRNAKSPDGHDYTCKACIRAERNNPKLAYKEDSCPAEFRPISERRTRKQIKLYEKRFAVLKDIGISVDAECGLVDTVLEVYGV